MKKLESIYLYVLGNKFLIAFLCVFPFLFLKKELTTELMMTSFIVLFSSFATAKKFSVKDAFIFSIVYCLLFFILEIGFLSVGISKSLLGPLVTLLLYAKLLAMTFSIRLVIYIFAGGVIFYIINFLTIKLLTWSRTEKIFMTISKTFSSPIKTLICAFLIILFSNVYSFASGIPIKIEPVPKFDDKNFITLVSVLDSNNLLVFSGKENKLYTYNFEKNYFNNHCPSFPEILEDWKEDSWSKPQFLKLNDGNIFIRRFIRTKEKPIQQKAFGYIYSPLENKLIFNEELPKEISHGQSAVVQISDNELLFIGARENLEDNQHKSTYIYNLNDKTLTKKSDSIKGKRRCSAIMLKDGRVFIIGGINERSELKTAEIYDITKDEFSEIDTGFVWKGTHKDDSLFMTDDGKVVIRTSAYMKNEEDSIGSWSGSIIDGSGYPVQYVAIFNPEDNSFMRVDFNKSKNEVIDDKYSILVTNDGKIIAQGGQYVKKIPLKEGKATEELRKKHPNFTKYRWGMGEAVDKLIFYDIKTGKKQYSYGKPLPPTLDPTMLLLNNNEYITIFIGHLGQKYEHRVNRIKF